ncbi:MAG: PilN domain-containing protein [Candidatus Omnitrophota bacterium]
MTVVLEIGAPWLKIAVFKSALGAFQLKAIFARDTGNFSEDAVSVLIADFLKELKIKKPQNLVICFSRNAVTLRNLRIPSVVPAEIEDMIKLHVGRQVPYAKEEIVNGFSVIGRDNMGYSKIMLAIVHRENIRRIFRILEKAELYTDRIELSSEGSLSWLSRAVKLGEPKPENIFIILDIDHNFTDFLVASPSGILFSRVIASGSEQLKDDEKWPRFLGEIKQTMVISQGEEVSQKPNRIYVIGAAGGLKGVASAIETEFNLPATIIAPTDGVALARDPLREPPDILHQLSFSSLIGLGIDPGRRKISFTLPEAQIRKALRERSRDIMFLASGIMYLILIICGIYGEKLHNRRAAIELLNTRYESIDSQSAILDEEVERLQKIKSKLDTDSIVLNYLLELSRLLPPEITITNLSFTRDDRINIKGQANQMSDIFKFITTLEHSPYFKDVQTRYTTRKKAEGRDINEFELICPMEKIKGQKKQKARAAKEKSPEE